MNILWRSAEIGNWIIIRKIVVLKARMANIKFFDTSVRLPESDTFNK